MVLLTIGDFPRRTSTRQLQVTFNIPYVYDFITQLQGHQAKVIHSHAKKTFHNKGQGEATHRKYKRLKVGGVSID
jgi:hypothetical protein